MGIYSLIKVPKISVIKNIKYYRMIILLCPIQIELK